MWIFKRKQLFATAIYQCSGMSCTHSVFWPNSFDSQYSFFLSFHLNLHSPSHQPLTLTPFSHPHPVIERLYQISHSTTVFQIQAFCFPWSSSLPLLCPSIVEETVAQTNRERRYPLVYRKIEEKEWQGSKGGDALADIRTKLITGEHQLEGTVMGLFASPRHPKNITISHHVYPLPPQDHSSHKPWLETAYMLKEGYGWGTCWQCLQT